MTATEEATGLYRGALVRAYCPGAAVHGRRGVVLAVLDAYGFRVSFENPAGHGRRRTEDVAGWMVLPERSEDGRGAA